jgi:integrase
MSNSGKPVVESKQESSARAASQDVNFATGSARHGAFKKPGRKNDTNATYLQLRVSEAGGAVWYYRFQGPNGKRVEKTLRGRAVPDDGDGTTTIDYKQAKDAVEKRVMEERTPESVKHEKSNRAHFHTLADGFEYFKANRMKKSKKPLAESTKADYDKVFGSYLAKRILDPKKYLKPPSEWELGKTGVMQWADLLRAIAKRSPAKALNCQAIISGIYGMGVALEVLDANPITNIRYLNTLAPLEKRTGHVDGVDFPKFFAAVESKLVRQNSKDPILLATMTGMRLSACLGMRWDQVDFDNGFYYVFPGQQGWKGFSGVLPLSDFVLDILKRRRQRAKRHSDYVFPAHHGDKPYRSRMDGAMRTVATEFTFQPTAQDLRRTFATAVALCFDDNMRKVGALLCHKWAVSKEGMAVSRDAITRRYVQSTLPQLRETADTAANFILELAGRRPLSERTIRILKENDPRNLRLLDFTEADEEDKLESLASDTMNREVMSKSTGVL